jgi:hypothetical protein
MAEPLQPRTGGVCLACMRIVVVGVLVTAAISAAPGTVDAECSRVRGLSPLSGASLPPRPHLLYFTDLEGLDQPFRPTISAAIDGIPAAIRVERLSGTGSWGMYEIEVLSDRTGRLEIEMPYEESSSYEIRAAPASRPPALVAYWRSQYEWSCSREDAAKLQIDQPAIAYRVRWRTGNERAMQTRLIPGLGHADLVVLGKVDCADETIPLEAMLQGIELQIIARLTDGSEQLVEGVPRLLRLDDLVPFDWGHGFGFRLVDAEELLRAYPHIAEYLPSRQRVAKPRLRR